jgi:hypothetical protein
MASAVMAPAAESTAADDADDVALSDFAQAATIAATPTAAAVNFETRALCMFTGRLE